MLSSSESGLLSVKRETFLNWYSHRVIIIKTIKLHPWLTLNQAWKATSWCSRRRSSLKTEMVLSLTGTFHFEFFGAGKLIWLVNSLVNRPQEVKWGGGSQGFIYRNLIFAIHQKNKHNPPHTKNMLLKINKEAMFGWLHREAEISNQSNFSDFPRITLDRVPTSMFFSLTF